MFRHDIPYMANQFFSLDIPVMIKIPHEKMLNAIFLYWFHIDTIAENNSINGHLDEP